ncbi:putative protein kinase RLK-Pelle-DLSV family [Helianthus annuus]|nr:putative protein kinase RLK-Pelle-DLSV family [Helianthus annuus]
MAPEYALRGYLTDKADVYSYGIVLLEIVSGTSNIPDRTKENNFVLIDRVTNFNLEVAKRMGTTSCIDRFNLFCPF